MLFKIKTHNILCVPLMCHTHDSEHDYIRVHARQILFSTWFKISYLIDGGARFK